MRKTKSTCLHLERRASPYCWRRRIPEFSSKSIPSPFLVFSLRTDVVREAEVLARRLTWLSSLAFDYSRGVANMEKGLMERVLTELVRFEIAASDSARDIAPERILEEAQMAAQRELALQDTLCEALLLRNREVARAPVHAAAARLRVNISENEENG